MPPAARRRRAARRGVPLPRRRGAGAARHLAHVRPGQTTAIVGSTGSGKTTLVNLIPRLYDVTGGAVLVDGVDVRELAAERLWSPHRAACRSGPSCSAAPSPATCASGRPDATDDELWHALDGRAGRRLRPARCPSGLEAPIDQGGANVSGGQRQRLAIARALVRRPAMYVFDDSFSALDYATDARLRAALRRETRDATVIIVAQRVSTILHADQIVVLDAGGSSGVGTHERAAGELPDLPRDRVLAAHRGGGGMSSASGPPPAVRPATAARRPRRRRAGRRWACRCRPRRPRDFRGTSAPAAGRLRPERLVVAVVMALGRGQRVPRRRRPEAARQRDQRDLRRASSASSCRPGSPRSRRSRAAGAGRDPAGRHARRR